MRCLVAITLMLSSCTDLTYWKPSGRQPIEVKHIVRVDFPCGLRGEAIGCSNFAANTIELDRRLTNDEADCVVKHERKHFAAYDHPAYNWSSSAPIDCGDGTFYKLTPMRIEILSRRVQ